MIYLIKTQVGHNLMSKCKEEIACSVMGAEREREELIICNVFFVRGNKHPNNKENITNN